jgi:VTC domain
LQARRLRPICQIAYQRIARVAGTQDGPIRLTLDRGIRAVPLQSVAFNELSPGMPVFDDQVIIEFKFRLGMPVFFKELVEQFGLNQKRISKYRMAAVALGLVAPDNPEPSASDLKDLCLNS